jgi:hypothetical protein
MLVFTILSVKSYYRSPEINLQLKIPQTPLEKGKTGEVTATIYLDLYSTLVKAEMMGNWIPAFAGMTWGLRPWGIILPINWGLTSY